ncbi:LPP20 family lipoprotein [Pseudoalteromonas sp. SWXJ133]|uniref:LPP20 family lipoprotein n=1 Tax=Pseudoalteromonas sp. SWXJ133 TaxID=2792069 RepID=UPI0018CD8F7C|nr:LPP20 family lipoprotein [Pseudoalteromonas sp. SWXJ133]MBH0021183.1 LPP20 family lipoprotein [Pseudoalteromonas sp. SWXJ133]
MKTSIFAFLIAFAFSSSAQNWPDWVTQPQKSDEYITAIGIGESRLAARQAALADIITQLSVDVSTQQLQKLTKQDNQSSNYFEQATTLTSLPFTLTGLEELNALEENNLFALKMGVKKSVLVKNLKSDLSKLSRISAPENNNEQRFIWALKNSGELNVTTKKLAVLEHLSGPKLFIQSTLNNLLTEQAKALNAVSCDVIGANNISTIKSALNNALPHSGDTRLWVRPQIRWQYAKSNNKYSAKAILTLALTRSSTPFKVLLQQDLVAQESAATQENAKQKAINNLVQQLKAPASQWLFDI